MTVITQHQAVLTVVYYNWKIKRDVPVSRSSIEILSHDGQSEEIT